MTYRIYPTFIASLGAIAVMLAANETVARPGTTARGAVTSMPSTHHSSALRPLRHHHHRFDNFNDVGTFWPGVVDGAFYGPSNGEPTADVGQPPSGDAGYTYGVPWDWAHQYPPIITPSGRPYVQSCPTQIVTVPGHDGKGQAVNVTQCF